MDVNVDGGLSIAFPLNQFSSQAILLETEGVSVANRFDVASSLQDFEEYCLDNPHSEDEYDCLIDSIELNCRNASFFEAFRRPYAQGSPQFHLNEVPAFDSGLRIEVPTTFQRFGFVKTKENLLDKPKTLTFTLYRNIDEFISHNAPNNSVILCLDNAELNVSTEFYKLMRGVLEKNFADPLIPVPESIPIEILQKPESTKETASAIRYATFAFRLAFSNVVWNCCSPATKRFWSDLRSALPAEGEDLFRRIYG
ncbi:hypothetical protein L596_027294 [Steinernema carpocapsae]|nr:hypothetical protein L596_027294 [Steinernema carpocapsae]